jgi:hypothetical protein
MGNTIEYTKYKKFVSPCRFDKGWIPSLFLLLLAGSCATYAPKYENPATARDVPDTPKVSHTFYLIGDAGLSPPDSMNNVLLHLRDRLEKASEKSTVVFLGDNIYPSGMPGPKKSPEAYREAKNNLDAQLKTLERYKGQPVFIPGNHDWYSNGLKGLKRQEKYVEDYLDRKGVFLPEDGCPLAQKQITEDILLITVDSKWYLSNWDRRPSINDDCVIKSREKFWAELEGAIKKNADKTIILAIHHPMFTYGEHGGQFSFRQQFYPSKGIGPLPALGSLINLFRKTSGVSPEDLFNRRYQEMQNRLLTLAAFGERVVITSGHEHTLQYIVEQGIPQIVSGAGAKTGYTRLAGGSRFSTGMGGYVVLQVFEDGSSRVRYYGVDQEGGERFLYTDAVFPPREPVFTEVYESDFEPVTRSSVYRQDEVDKGKLYRRLWGERYRKYYGTEVYAPTVRLDTLYGGLVPVRKGGGQQSKSLRLRHSSGKEYVMRAVRKQAEQNLQAMAFQDRYIMGEFEGTAPVEFLQDLYTGAHPYAPFVLDPLSDSLGIYHTNPALVYVPKQAALGKYNRDFGDELYMIEEHVSAGHQDLASFGYARDIESTYEMLQRLREDEKYTVDTQAYIRARLFDMLIGDWDRHQDQWRWAEFRQKGSGRVLYRPIPRDRDQVFSKMGDGSIGWILTRLVPAVKKMEGFTPEIRNVRTFNSNGFTLDRTLLGQTTLEDWMEQAVFIQKKITPGLIDRAFEGFPPEVLDNTPDHLKKIMLERLEDLDTYARSYFEVLQEQVIIQGTDKDDWFEVKGAGGKRISVSGYRIINGEKDKRFYQKTFDPKLTREIWLYGLDDSDRFEIDLPKNNDITVRIVGGQGKDRYEVISGKKVRLYDYESKKSVISGPGRAKTLLTDDYDINTYIPLKPGDETRQVFPVAGYNPDDGIKLGLGYTLTRYGFLRNPFSARHALKGAYYFATRGVEMAYTGEFARVVGRWNLLMDAGYRSPNFTNNFFGFGNDTPNPEDELGLNYNRVRIRRLDLSPSLIWRGSLGGSLKMGLGYEYITVEETEGRFISTFFEENELESDSQYLGVSGLYHYENRDEAAFPTLGMEVSLEAGYKQEVSGAKQNFGYVIPTLALDHRLLPSGNLVLATRWKAHFNIGDGYAFFQGAQIGASDGPRSYRNQRFTGKTSYYQLTDLRYQFGQMKTALLPVSLGMFAGFDYGRIWQPGESSRKWHTSYGGGIFINGAQRFSANANLFYGADGVRISLGLGFDF